MRRIASLAGIALAGSFSGVLAVAAGLLAVDRWPGVPGRAAGVMAIAVRGPIVQLAADAAFIALAIGLCMIAIARVRARAPQ